MRTESKETAISTGVVESVSRYLLCKRADVQLIAASALMSISVSESGMQRVISAKDTVRSLCTLALQKEIHHMLRHNTRGTLSNIVERPEGTAVHCLK